MMSVMVVGDTRSIMWSKVRARGGEWGRRGRWRAEGGAGMGQGRRENFTHITPCLSLHPLYQLLFFLLDFPYFLS